MTGLSLPKELRAPSLFVVITRNIRPADQVYIREHNGDGRAAFNALQEQHGGAGTSQATLMASMASFYNVTMETDDDVATMADRVHTTIGRISDHNKVRNKTAAHDGETGEQGRGGGPCGPPSYLPS